MKNKEKRLGISQSWYTRSMRESDDQFIRKLVRGIFLEHDIFISEIYINRYPERISIKFLMHLTYFLQLINYYYILLILLKPYLMNN